MRVHRLLLVLPIVLVAAVGPHVHGAAADTTYTYTVTQLPMVGSCTDDGVTSINDAGQVALDCASSDLSFQAGYIWQNGAVSLLMAPGGTYSQAIGINDSGLVLGGGDSTNGPELFLYQNGTYTNVNSPAVASTGWQIRPARWTRTARRRHSGDSPVGHYPGVPVTRRSAEPGCGLAVPYGH
jgi:large exoprotein involved in heme utilization and adhesion